jgi:hypothetical protein
MRVRSLVALVALVVGFGVAHAGPKQDISAKVKEAYENYDLMDYDAAKKSLNQAIAIAKKAKLDKDPVVAKAHLAMGIVALVEKDTDAAKVAFLSAVQVDPKIQIDAGYKSPEASKLLESARTEASGGPADEPPPPPDAGGPDCAAVKGLDHKIIDSGKTGVALPIEALVAPDVTATKIAVMYRAEGATEFTEVKLKKDGTCKYTGSIPKSAMKGTMVHYYVAAFNEFGKPIASKGSSGSPNIVELTASAGGGGGETGGGGDTEDPIVEGGGGSVEKGLVVERKPTKLLVAVAGGTGFGYVAGETEGMNTVKNCCLGSSLVVIQPELGYYVSPQLSVGVVARIGLPIGANVEGHATAAPGGLLRVRYALGAGGEGIRFMGQAGIGVMRNTIKLDNSEPGMDTDVVAQGPLLFGAGVGYARRLSNNLSFIADLSALVGLPIGNALSGLSPKFNTGFGADLSIGLQIGI